MIDSGSHQFVELARAGDQNAYTKLFEQSRAQIEAVGSEILRGPDSKENLEDFCSDVWLLGLKYVRSFREESSFTTWIVKIARHKALATIQRRGQMKNGDNRLVYQGYDTHDDQWETECSAGEDRPLDAASAQSDIAGLMETISQEYRELVQLHHLEGFTETEIAKKTGLSVPAIRGRLSRAMVQLRKKVEKGADRNGPKISLTIQRVILREGESSE